MTDTTQGWKTDDEIRIGLSSCLLGNEVRFDGSHKHDRFLTGTVGAFVSFVTVCPEVEVGMTIPRESVRLVAGEDGVRMVAPKSGTDWTAPMRAYAEKKAAELAALDLCGFILKKDSPSCGMERVKIYYGKGMPNKAGVGLFAEALMKAAPLLPVEEEGRIHDPLLRANFFERVFAYRRLRSFFATPFRTGDLVEFHSREKLLLMAHDRPAYTALGQLVAKSKGVPRATLSADYQAAFLGGLTKLATTRKHYNVLQHISGYLKKVASDGDREEFRSVTEDFKVGLVPLVVPITLARHHVRAHGIEYLQRQTYLEPHPKELMLRNHV